MPRHFYDPEDASLFEADELRRRNEMRADAEALSEKLRAEEEAERAAREERLRVWSVNGNKREILRGYHERGLEPPAVDADGFPFLSVEMLLRIGWEIRDVSGKPTLIAPQPRPVAKTREDYARESS